MKKAYIVLIFVFLAAGFSSIPIKTRAQASISFQVFYNDMSPYGSWVNYPRYGYVWVPTSVPYGFRPYSTGGHWVYTPDGWTWVSDYPWGWAAFHYGNWFYDDTYGWMWLPGYEWAPAWVTWGEYEDNYCWAPIAPGIDIGVSFTSYRPPSYCWTFVPRSYITSANISHYYINHQNTTVINNITVINNVNREGGGRAFVRGPQPQNVERYTHAPVRPVQIRPTSNPGRGQVQNGQLTLYRPAVNRNAPTRPVPPRVQELSHLQANNLPATNRHAQTNINEPNRNPGNKSSNPANPARRTVVPRPVDKSSPNNDHANPNPNSRTVTRPVNPHENTPARPSNPVTPQNKTDMHPENNNHRPATAPMKRPVSPPPHVNHPAPNPATTRPNPGQQPRDVQPRPQPAHANPPRNVTPPPPAHNPPPERPRDHK